MLLRDEPADPLQQYFEQTEFAQIEKQFGKGSVMRLGAGEAVEDIQVV
ncbi:MAG TPA: recombinase RecA, partial [Paraburkholderia sp.]|nr:recombinase RecA [Paraburkholderia sp.]